MGCSGFRLLRLLPPKHAEVEDIPPYVRWIGFIVLVRGFSRYWIGLRDRNERGLV